MLVSGHPRPKAKRAVGGKREPPNAPRVIRGDRARERRVNPDRASVPLGWGRWEGAGGGKEANGGPRLSCLWLCLQSLEK